jgi:Fic family protein
MILGRLDQCNFKVHRDIRLRKTSDIRSVKSSLAIEGHSLIIEQASDILNGHPEVAPQNDIVAVKNARKIMNRDDTEKLTTNKKFLTK